jgi:hypothetical protein
LSATVGAVLAEEFPPELWQWVMDDEKPKVKERWERFPSARRKELMEALMDIKISEEDEGRRMEAPLFRAQILANIDKFGHPNPDQPPNIKGFEFRIALEEWAVPFRTKPRRLSILERMSLAA